MWDGIVSYISEVTVLPFACCTASKPRVSRVPAQPSMSKNKSMIIAKNTIFGEYPRIGINRIEDQKYPFLQKITIVFNYGNHWTSQLKVNVS